MEERLQKIQEKIEKKNVDLDQKDKFHGQKALTRHEMELERSLLRTKVKLAANKLPANNEFSCIFIDYELKLFEPDCII